MLTAAVCKMTDAWTQEFEDVFNEYAPMLYRTAYSVTRSPQDAEDVVQTLFLGLLRGGMPQGLKQNPRPYLHRAAVNLSLNAVRRRGRYVPITESTIERLSDGSGSDEAEHGVQLQRRLAQAMTRLHPRDVEVLVLRYEHDYSDAQIAKMLGKSRGAIAVALYRARARLKRWLAADSSGKKL